MNLQKMYKHRFPPEEVKAMAAIWKVLVDDFFSRWIGTDDAVIDIGAGYCNFINQVDAARRVAVDANPAVAENCAEGVEFFETTDLGAVDFGAGFDVAFLSNFLEHLENAEAVLRLLADTRKILKPGARVIVLQPNFALTGAKYFDFIDHKTILTDKSLVEALELSGYRVTYVKKHFLPYTSKSALPKAPWMVRLYLKVPLVHRFMAGQSLVVATPADG